jgi:hypothetical protein
MNRKRFWVAAYSATDKRADWFDGDAEEAGRRWPGAISYTDATDMTDDQFEKFILDEKTTANDV